MTSLRVTARLDRPSVGLVDHPFLLDAPVSWAAAQAAIRDGEQLPPITGEHVPDFDLPFARWDEGGTWGWMVSQADLTVEAWTAVEIRRKPATAEMARFTRESRHHSGLGPHKARDVIVSAAWVTRAVWEAEVTDRDRLEALLALVTHLGAHAGIGYGHVASWEIGPGTPNGWRHRPMPDPAGRVQGIRAPYWHHSRKVAAA